MEPCTPRSHAQSPHGSQRIPYIPCTAPPRRSVPHRCALVTDAYLVANCTPTTDVYRLGPVGSQRHCVDDPWPKSGHRCIASTCGDYTPSYLSPFYACGGTNTALQMRAMGYAALCLNFNVLLYVLLQECTADISKAALSKMASGATQNHTHTCTPS